MLLRDLGEDALIQRLRARLEKAQSPSDGFILGPGDDAAVLECSPALVSLFTCDALVEDIHFQRAWTPPRSLGWKALAVNVSDIAAMGGWPTFALVTLSLPGETEVEYVDAIYDGLIACGEEYDCRIAGGDLVGSPGSISISVSLLGEVEPEHLLRRSGAKPGDAILVTGDLGAAAAGLSKLTGLHPSSLIPHPSEASFIPHPSESRLLEPCPRLAEARFLAQTGQVTALMDLSDGLADDLPRLCQESGVGARVFAEAVPRHPEATPLQALSGGEDYELLFTASPEEVEQLAKELLNSTGTKATVIGEIVDREQGVRFLDASGKSLSVAGYRHFEPTLPKVPNLREGKQP